MEDYSGRRADENRLISTFLPRRLLCTTGKWDYTVCQIVQLLISVLNIFSMNYNHYGMTLGKSESSCCQMFIFIILVYCQKLLFHIYIQFVCVIFYMH